MGTTYSGKEIVKAGKLLRDLSADKTSSEFLTAMDVSSYWRFTHETPLEKALNLLEKIALKEDKSALFAKRLKRIDSIIRKLQRLPAMKLKTMQDIGGCRCIVSNNKSLRRIVKELKKNPEFKDESGGYRAKDYIKNPKNDGYRSYHLVGNFTDNANVKKKIEVQLRTNKQHYWATAVEIVDLFTGQLLKINQGNDDWKLFFALVSWNISIIEAIPSFDQLEPTLRQRYYIDGLSKQKLNSADKLKKTQLLCKKLKVINKLNGFSKALQVIDNQIHNASPTQTGYALLEIDTNKAILQSTLFNEKKSEQAEQLYGQKEKNYVNKPNMVIALVSTTAIGGVKEAYPNYFADSSEFVKILHLIMSIKVK